MKSTKETKTKKSADNRKRNFATVVYPESAPKNWLEVLSEQKVPAFVSPAHDRDINPNGEPKKAHFHVMVMFDGLKSPEQVKEIFDAIGGVGLEVVQSIRGYARYLCHLDNPEKQQYNTEDVMQYGGADYVAVIGLATDKHKAISEMISFCYDNDIYIYADLLEFAMVHRFDWFRVLCDNGTVVVKEYLKSRQYK